MFILEIKFKKKTSIVGAVRQKNRAYDDLFLIARRSAVCVWFESEELQSMMMMRIHLVTNASGAR